MWIELNMECPLPSLKDRFLMQYVKPVIDTWKNAIESWHFLWESNPYPCTLMIRFSGDEDTLMELSANLESNLQGIKHCYGRFGDCVTYEEYVGEAHSWGNECWKRGVQFLKFGSEFALELVMNRNRTADCVSSDASGSSPLLSL